MHGVMNGAPGWELGDHSCLSREAVKLLRLRLPIQTVCSYDGIFVAHCGRTLILFCAWLSEK